MVHQAGKHGKKRHGRKKHFLIKQTGKKNSAECFNKFLRVMVSMRIQNPWNLQTQGKITLNFRILS